MPWINKATVVTAGILIFEALAQAQYRSRDMYEPRSVSALVDRVHDDLRSSYGGWRFSNGDRDRLNHAEHELHDFAKQWNRGRFDKDELDEAISSIQHVVDNNRMPRRDRDALYEDLDRLRGMREAYNRHEIGYDRRY